MHQAFDKLQPPWVARPALYIDSKPVQENLHMPPAPPSSASAPELHARGLERLSYGDLQGARTFLTEAVAKGGGAESRCQLAICLRRLGDQAEAERDFQATLAEEPGQTQAWFGLLFLYQEMNRQEEMRTLLGRLRAHFSNDCVTLHKVGGLMGELGYHADAAQIYESILKAEPEARNYQRLGQYYQKLGRYPEAEAAFLAAIDRNPKAGPAYLLLANTRRFTADDAPLMARFETALKERGLTPNTEACLHFGLGKIHDDQGQYDEAFAHFVQGNQLRKADPGFNPREWREFARELQSRKDTFPDVVSPLPDKAPTPLFIVGMLRSGTTLVERILASHTQVRGMGEVNWIAELVGLANKQAGTEYPALMDLLSDSQVAELRAAYASRWPRGGKGAAYIVDKNPLNFIYLGLIARMFPNARIVHCQRDPRDTGASIYFQNFANAVNSYAYDLRDIGQFHNGYREVMQHWQRVLPQGMLHTVVYEKLVAQQEDETRRLLSALGLEWEPGCLEFHSLGDNIATASVWQARQALYATAVGRWRHYAKHLKPLIDTLAAG